MYKIQFSISFYPYVRDRQRESRRGHFVYILFLNKKLHPVARKKNTPASIDILQLAGRWSHCCDARENVGLKNL